MTGSTMIQERRGSYLSPHSFSEMKAHQWLGQQIGLTCTIFGYKVGAALSKMWSQPELGPCNTDKRSCHVGIFQNRDMPPW